MLFTLADEKRNFFNSADELHFFISQGRCKKLPDKVTDIIQNAISNDNPLLREATEEDLHKLFSVCGTVRSINMVNDPRSGQFRGIAFVCMSNDAETREAINMLDGTRLIDRCIGVAAAKTKEEMAATTTVEIPEKRARRKRVPKGRKKVR